jgi:hypothetical protein
MKIAWMCFGLVLAGTQMSASRAVATSPVNSIEDKITGLPVYPGVTEPAPLPATVLCSAVTGGTS